MGAFTGGEGVSFERQVVRGACHWLVMGFSIYTHNGTGAARDGKRCLVCDLQGRLGLVALQIKGTATTPRDSMVGSSPSAPKGEK